MMQMISLYDIPDQVIVVTFSLCWELSFGTCGGCTCGFHFHVFVHTHAANACVRDGNLAHLLRVITSADFFGHGGRSS